nr:MAG TPA: hypothetical protein [Caudoviricetes sp.]
MIRHIKQRFNRFTSLSGSFCFLNFWGKKIFAYPLWRYFHMLY